jgi:hypothetical protein
MQYIDVVIDNKSANTDTLYTYRASDEVKAGAKRSGNHTGEMWYGKRIDRGLEES